MEVKRKQTNNDSEFVKELENLIEKVKAGQIEDCQIKVVIAKEEKPVEEEEFECNGDCENCENYVEEENDPEDILEDLGNAIGCMVYYRLPLPTYLVYKYNDLAIDANEDS